MNLLEYQIIYRLQIYSNQNIQKQIKLHKVVKAENQNKKIKIITLKNKYTIFVEE